MLRYFRLQENGENRAVLPVDNISYIARFRDEDVVGGEVGVTDDRLNQLLFFRNDIRGDSTIVQQAILLQPPVYLPVPINSL